MGEVKRVAYSCSFYEDVICPHKECSHNVAIAKCSICSHYRRFMAEMEAEEDEFFDEVDRIRGSD